jgi:hypothetical protein
MNYTPRENSIVKSILKYINGLPRCKAEKRHGSIYTGRGKQDILACIAGKHVELEVKRPGEEAEPIQVRIREQWARAGAVTGCVHSVGEVKDLFKAHGMIR